MLNEDSEATVVIGILSKSLAINDNYEKCSLLFSTIEEHPYVM